MRVHLTLKNSVLASAEGRQQTLAQLRALGLSAVDRKRFERYGLLSGDVDPLRVPDLESLDAVESVEPDEMVRALGSPAPPR